MTEPWVIVHADAGDTERAAAAYAEDQYPQRALAVLQYLLSVDGDYDTHGADAMKMWLNSYAPARNALMRKGMVEDSRRRERNERGRMATVWTVTAAGRLAAETGDLDVTAERKKRVTRSVAALEEMTQWATCLAEALEAADPDNSVLKDWREARP